MISLCARVPKDEGINDKRGWRGGGVTSEPTEIVPGVLTTGQIQRVTPFERAVSPSEEECMHVDGEEIDDEILDDQALWMDVEQVGPFAITGCAHSGSLNTLRQVQRLGRARRQSD